MSESVPPTTITPTLLTTFLVILSVFGGRTSSQMSPIASICSVVWTPSTAYYIFDDIIKGSPYIKHIRPINESSPAHPTTGATPTNVEINFHVINIDNIDDTNGSFRVQLFFRQAWVDPRLSYANTPQYQNQCSGNRPTKLNVPDSMIHKIWTPDLYIVQELDSKKHGTFHPDRFMKVSPDGNVLFSQRITLTLSCPQLTKPDWVKKECEMNIESYGYFQDEIVLDWTDQHPVHAMTDIFVPKGYKLDKVTPHRCDTVTSSGNYSCVQGKFTLSRGTGN